MIQVLPKARSFGEEFGRAIGTGAGEGISDLASQYRQQKALSKENEDIFKATGIRLSSLDPDMRKMEFSEKLKGLSSEKENESEKDFWNGIFGGNEKTTESPEQKYPGIGQPQGSKSQQKGFSPLDITDEMIAKAPPKRGVILRNLRADARSKQEKDNKQEKEFEDRIREKQHVKNLLSQSGKYDDEEIERLSETLDAPSARQLLKTQTEPKPYESTADKLNAERTDEFIKSVSDKGRAAEEGMRGLEVGMDLHREGATGYKFNNWLADYFKNPALADPRSKAFNANMKKEYNGIAAAVGGKVSNFEFQIFQGRVAQAEDSPQAAEALMVSSMMEKKIAIKEQEITERLREEYFDKGENLPANFDIVVKKELRPYADHIMRETSEQLNNILNPTTETNKDKYKQAADRIWG